MTDDVNRQPGIKKIFLTVSSSRIETETEVCVNVT